MLEFACARTSERPMIQLVEGSQKPYKHSEGTCSECSCWLAVVIARELRAILGGIARILVRFGEASGVLIVVVCAEWVLPSRAALCCSKSEQRKPQHSRMRRRRSRRRMARRHSCSRSSSIKCNSSAKCSTKCSSSSNRNTCGSNGSSGGAKRGAAMAQHTQQQLGFAQIDPIPSE